MKKIYIAISIIFIMLIFIVYIKLNTNKKIEIGEKNLEVEIDNLEEKDQEITVKNEEEKDIYNQKKMVLDLVNKYVQIHFVEQNVEQLRNILTQDLFERLFSNNNSNEIKKKIISSDDDIFLNFEKIYNENITAIIRYSEESNNKEFERNNVLLEEIRIKKENGEWKISDIINSGIYIEDKNNMYSEEGKSIAKGYENDIKIARENIKNFFSTAYSYNIIDNQQNYMNAVENAKDFMSENKFESLIYDRKLNPIMQGGYSVKCEKNNIIIWDYAYNFNENESYFWVRYEMKYELDENLHGKKEDTIYKDVTVFMEKNKNGEYVVSKVIDENVKILSKRGMVYEQ